jgi:alpha-tubulin suppressor-like RCC1 family protein
VVVGAEGGGDGGDASGPGGPNVQLALSYEHSCAIRNGELYCWGANDNGQLGVGSLANEIPRPTRVGTAGDWTWVSTGGLHTCGIRGGALYCWGENAQGELGMGPDVGNVLEPQLVGTGWTSVSCAQNSTCGIQSDGSVWCWGGNDRGEAGIPSVTDEQLPIRVALAGAWQTVISGANYTVALGPAGYAMWGGNEEGQAGSGVYGPIDIPPSIVNFGFAIASIVVGNEHDCTTDAGGVVRCWGDNRSGQIGNGTLPNDQLTPAIIDVGGVPDLLAAGGFTTCAVRAGELRCWGNNEQGQLGLGDSGLGTERTLPTRVGTATDWHLVQPGVNHTCGVRDDGLYCWGDNRRGQLGTGTVQASPQPVPVGPIVF